MCMSTKKYTFADGWKSVRVTLLWVHLIGTLFGLRQHSSQMVSSFELRPRMWNLEEPVDGAYSAGFHPDSDPWQVWNIRYN